MLIWTMLILATQKEYGAPPDKERLDGLLLSVAQGNWEAFGELYGCARAAVYGLAISYLKAAEEAQDITQEVFVRIWEKAGQYRPCGKPMAWILTIARNLSLMRLREQGKYQWLEASAWEAIPADAPAVTQEDRELLQTVLGRLSDKERQVILLHIVAGLKHRETAEVLQMPLATVLSQYHRALKKLRVQWEGAERQ